LVEPGLINRLVNKFESDQSIQMVTAAHPFSDPADALSPHQVKEVIDRKNCALYFSRAPIPYLQSSNQKRAQRQMPQYLRHQGIYGFRRDLLLQLVSWKPGPLERAESLEQLRALENGVTVHVLVTRHGSPGVDTPQDAKNLERKLSQAGTLAGANPRRR
jgi:3-deoxy-manno-octulosonate cytidylyltransferase (CMP-KDO synthetase)